MYKTRIMAARALRPLVSKDLVPEIIKQLLGSLPKARGAGISHNYIHGILLQVSLAGVNDQLMYTITVIVLG